MFENWGTLRHRVCAAAICAMALLTPDAQAERIELVNGDVLTGQVTAQTDTHLTLKHAVLGEITLERARIKQVLADKPKADVKADKPKPDKTKAPPKPAADPAKVQEQAKQKAAENDAENGWWLSDWNNRLTLGFTGSQGNTERQDYRVAFRTKYEDGRDRWVYDSKWLYAYANGARTQNQFRADLTRDWLQQESHWFFFLKGRYQYDANRSWEHRTSGFGGGGYTFVKDDGVEVNARLGFGGTYEHGDVNEFTPEALFGGSVIKWNLTDRAAISGETIYYPSLENEADFRIDSKIEWSYKLDMAKGLSLKLGLENEYDSRTPNEPGNNDTRYYGALVFDF